MCVWVRVEIFDTNNNMGRVQVAYFNLSTHQPDTIDTPTCNQSFVDV
ncbi:hypothetical protein HanXRQr2_Chr15g0673421 [Helianthus annuus]|uniref:Uncharacterized protein n=1 Tax=Helianthus annuus TaxID=4232 RepID=A0A9K3DYE3_HELAN|nr:hypothetical protein HanXRQr2_Chr15g0673421 [Helianthus annuus]